MRIFLTNLCCSSATYQLQLMTNQSHWLNCFKYNKHLGFFVIIRFELVLTESSGVKLVLPYVVFSEGFSSDRHRGGGGSRLRQFQH